jgi:hypothetical protein
MRVQILDQPNSSHSSDPASYEAISNDRESLIEAFFNDDYTVTTLASNRQDEWISVETYLSWAQLSTRLKGDKEPFCINLGINRTNEAVYSD